MTAARKRRLAAPKRKQTAAEFIAEQVGPLPVAQLRRMAAAERAVAAAEDERRRYKPGDGDRQACSMRITNFHRARGDRLLVWFGDSAKTPHHTFDAHRAMICGGRLVTQVLYARLCAPGVPYRLLEPDKLTRGV